MTFMATLNGSFEGRLQSQSQILHRHGGYPRTTSVDGRISRLPTAAVHTYYTFPFFLQPQRDTLFPQRGYLEICCGKDFLEVYQLRLPAPMSLRDQCGRIFSRASSTPSINSSLPPTTVLKLVPQHHTFNQHQATWTSFWYHLLFSSLKLSLDITETIYSQEAPIEETNRFKPFTKRTLNHLRRQSQSKQFIMCKRYKITYSCGCTKPEDAPCAESPNMMGGCSEGTIEKEATNDGPCDDHA
ncbi:hypothetical protein K449DRAFT_432754 [Hypoxylon sp. EC38]|nr:hypothetical protein K449DRAFT_432754 [Hypoxylon sp. EC38]